MEKGESSGRINRRRQCTLARVSEPRLGAGLPILASLVIGGCVIDSAPRRVTAELPIPATTTDQTEPSVAIDPTDTSRILVGAIEVATEQCRFMISEDNGETWSTGLIETGDRDFCTDPSVAFDGSGTAYFAGFFYDDGGGTQTNTGVGVARSADGGLSFLAPNIFGGNHAQQTSVDKPYIAIDTTGGALDGAVHVVWNTVSLTTCDGSFCPRAIWIATSTDGGANFSIPLKASGTILGGSNNFGASAAVAPDGHVYVAWRQFHRFLGNPPSWEASDAIFVRRIDPSARTLDPEAQVIFLDQQSSSANVQGTLRTTRYPIVGVSKTAGTAGDVYIVFADDLPQTQEFAEPEPEIPTPIPGQPPAPPPPDIETVPRGINKWGKIVGTSVTTSNSGNTTSGFFHDGQEIIYINVSGAAMTVANDLNDHDTIVGYYLDGIGFERGFTMQAGGFSSVRTPIFPLSYPTAVHTRPFGINNQGTIVGAYTDANGRTHGFVFEGGVFSSIDYPGADATQARGVSEQGAVVGMYLAGGDVHGFRLESGSYTTIDHTDGDNTVLHDINSSGLVVGSHEVGGEMRAFAYDGTTFSRLAATFGGSEALGISDNRQIVGRAATDGFLDNGTPSQDIWMTRSGDQGVTWSPPQRVNDDMRGDQFDPWMSVGPFGQVHVVWLDRRNDPQNFLYDAYYAATSDGGQTFTENQKLSSASSDPRLASLTDNDGDGFIGDYIGIAANPEVAHAVWPDLRDAVASGQNIHHAAVNCDIIDLGDGTVADTCAGLTWLKDANYPDTLGMNPGENGAMTWDEAHGWALNLQFVGYDDWRLPKGRFPDFNCEAGATPYIGVDCVGSELGYLYYARGITAATPVPFTNIPGNPAWYWGSRFNSPLLTATIGNPGRAWAFKMQSGEMGSANAGSTQEVYAWPVRDIKVTDTYPGADSLVEPTEGVAVIFANVLAGGATTVAATDQNPQSDPTIAFFPPFYEITSTATFDDDMQICLDYEPASLGGQPEAGLRLAQFDGSAWSIAPAPPGTVNEVANVVCAPTTALGWFAVAGT